MTIWDWIIENRTENKTNDDWFVTSIIWSIWTRKNATIFSNTVKTRDMVVREIFSLITYLRVVFPCHLSFEN